jgi:tetratricopeptide (TPR) repeat protein
MRFAELAELAVRAAAVAALAAGVVGCATVMEIKDKVMPASGASAAPATAASASAATRAAAVVNDTPLSPAVQRAFDDAVRAQRAGKAADAERGYRALMQSNPELGGPHANLGVMLRHSAKLTESAAELEQAVKLNPRQPVYLNQLGITYRQLGQFDKARDAYERAIAADPDYAAASLNLGILNDLYLGDAKRASELYERYLALSPGGDAAVTKWVAELKNRKPAQVAATRKEKS